MEISKEKIKAYALKNAIAYEGKSSQGAVISALFNEGMKKEEVKDYAKIVSEVLQEVNALSLSKQEKEYEKLKEEVSERVEREGLPELPNSENGVVMRFAPSASGPMHAAHAIVASLSINYVNKYGGKFYLRIEDTNPEKTYPDSYKMLTDEGNWLTKGEAEIVIQSDRMDKYYDAMDKLVGTFNAYVCMCTGDAFRELAKNKQECPCRRLSQKEQLSRLANMYHKYQDGEAILRFKSDMRHKNPAMRDFPLARINSAEHPRQGDKYRVWPLMNLAVAIDDMELGMTHIIRGKDHRDNALRQEMIYKVYDKVYPWTGYLGRYHFKGLEFSTSKFKEGIESGEFSGWDDKKLPTIAALRKKYKPEAFWKMAEHIGISEVDKTFEAKDFFKLLDEFNSEQ